MAYKRNYNANPEIYSACEEHGLYLWQFARLVGMSESNLYRYLRSPLPDNLRDQWLKLIQEAAHNAE